MIWEKLWARHCWRTDWLSYDILLSPHHCSWHSLSHDSWSELREKAGVSEDARNALSQARDGATIVASSKPIEDDDNDPPCIRAKREYEGIAEDAAGSFECVGEYPSKRSPDVMELESVRSKTMASLPLGGYFVVAGELRFEGRLRRPPSVRNKRGGVTHGPKCAPIRLRRHGNLA